MSLAFFIAHLPSLSVVTIRIYLRVVVLRRKDEPGFSPRPTNAEQARVNEMTSPVSREEIEQWIQRSRDGDDAACRALYEAFSARVKGYFFRCGLGPADVEDLTQDVFARVFRALDSFDPARGTFRLWLGVIARNVVRSNRSRRPPAASFDPVLAEDMLVARLNSEQSPEMREEMKALHAGVESLPSELARILRLRYVEGRTTRGVGAVLGLPEATVRLRLKEAIGLLARDLRAKGFQ